MKEFKLNYRGDVIVVESRWNGEKLYVNGQLQDEQIGAIAFRSRLWGRLPSGEAIKVSLGGVFNMHCRIFIDEKLELSK